jgi:hypothetical protein
MNRYVIAVAVAVFSSSALALEIGPPFEQTQLDRELPDIQFAPVTPYAADSKAPYEQLVVDRALPEIYFPPVEPYVADSSAPYEQVQVDRILPNLPGQGNAAAGATKPGSARSEVRGDLGRYFEAQRQITDGYMPFMAQPQ